MKHLYTWIAAVVALIATPLAQAGFTVGGITYDESILTDDFNGATLNSQWASHVVNNGSVTMNGTDSMLLRTAVSGTVSSTKFIRSTAYVNYETDGGLNY